MMVVVVAACSHDRTLWAYWTGRGTRRHLFAALSVVMRLGSVRLSGCLARAVRAPCLALGVSNLWGGWVVPGWLAGWLAGSFQSMGTLGGNVALVSICTP